MRRMMICGLLALVFVGCGPQRERGPEVGGEADGGTTFMEDAGEPAAERSRPIPDPEPEPEPEPAAPTGEDVVQAYRRVMQEYCNTAHTCRFNRIPFPTEAEDAAFVRDFGTYEGDCMALRYDNPHRDALRAAVDEGRATYDDDQAARCQEQIERDKWVCYDFWDGYDACQDLFIGTLPHGDACVAFFECENQVCGDDGTCR